MIATALHMPSTAEGLSRFTGLLSAHLVMILPELVLVAGLLGLLLARLAAPANDNLAGALALATLVAAGAAAVVGPAFGVGDSFFGMLRVDPLAAFVKVLIAATGAVVVWLSLTTRYPLADDGTDYFVLLVGAALGMCLMASANDLVMIVIALEMASLPSYCLAGFLRRDRLAGEASLKYVVFGAASAGLLIYGVSLLAGFYGTTHLPQLAERIGLVQQTALGPPAAPGADQGVAWTLAEAQRRKRLQMGEAVVTGAGNPTVLGLALLLLFVGLAFKLSLVPFHFWCPDAFQGASAEVAGFLSVASKGAALALALRLVLTIGGVWDDQPDLKFLQGPATVGLGVVAAVTATFGNLAAYTQTNLKRLLAYSTIAHAGLLLMGLAALNRDGAHAVLFYLALYLLMNLGAFAGVSLIYRATGAQDLTGYVGLGRRQPLLGVTLAIFLLSLVGLPPLAGFAAKFRLFLVLFESNLIWLLVVGLANTLLSLFYYVNVLKVMFLQAPEPGTSESPVCVSRSGTALIVALSVLVVLLGCYWAPLEVWVDQCIAGTFGR